MRNESKGLDTDYICLCGWLPRLYYFKDGVMAKCANPACPYAQVFFAPTKEEVCKLWDAAFGPLHKEEDDKSLRDWLADMNPGTTPEDFDDIDMEFFEKLIEGEIDGTV